MSEPLQLPDTLAAILKDLPLEQLAFTPVPVKARRDGWTAARQRGLVDRLALGATVAVAARGVGMSRESAYRLRERAGAASFAAAWDKASEWGEERMADLALERALIGEVRPIFYRGVKRGEYVRHDNRIVAALLARHFRLGNCL